MEVTGVAKSVNYGGTRLATSVTSVKSTLACVCTSVSVFTQLLQNLVTSGFYTPPNNYPHQCVKDKTFTECNPSRISH